VEKWLLGEVDFWICWIFNFLQLAIDGKNNSKAKVEKVLYFHVFLCGNEFLKIKKSLKRVTIVF
jgi:hypothetical protein